MNIWLAAALTSVTGAIVGWFAQDVYHAFGYSFAVGMAFNFGLWSKK